MTHLSLGSCWAGAEGPMGERLLEKGNRKRNDGIQGYREGKERTEKRRNREMAKEKEKLLF